MVKNIIQKPIGLKKEQIEWLKKNPKFNINRFFRFSLNEQIRILDPDFDMEAFDIDEN